MRQVRIRVLGALGDALLLLPVHATTLVLAGHRACPAPHFVRAFASSVLLLLAVVVVVAFNPKAASFKAASVTDLVSM